MSDKIRLDPDLFMALGFSAEENGGIGWASAWTRDGSAPCCAVGHAWWLDGAVGHSVPRCEGQAEGLLNRAVSDPSVKFDARMQESGVAKDAKVSFERWCELVSVDVTE